MFCKVFVRDNLETKSKLLPNFGLQDIPPPGLIPERKPAPQQPPNYDDFHHQKLKSKIRKLIDSKMRDARNGKRIDIMSRKVTDQIEGLFQGLISLHC